jgi:hypothetical protein
MSRGPAAHRAGVRWYFAGMRRLNSSPGAVDARYVRGSLSRRGLV